MILGFIIFMNETLSGGGGVCVVAPTRFDLCLAACAGYVSRVFYVCYVYNMHSMGVYIRRYSFCSRGSDAYCGAAAHLSRQNVCVCSVCIIWVHCARGRFAEEQARSRTK